MNALLNRIFLIAAIGMAMAGVWKTATGVAAWMDANNRVEAEQARLDSVKGSMERTRMILAQGRKVRFDKSIIEAALDLMFNLKNEAAQYGVTANINVSGSSSARGTVDFKQISEPVPDAKGFSRIPVKVSITNWESSSRLFAWMQKSLMERQFMPTEVRFNGAMEIEGYIYGKELNQ